MGFADKEYEAAGAEVVDTADVWRAALVAQFKSPQLSSLSLLGKDSTVAAMMHAEGKRELVEHLVDRKARAIAFEYLTKDGNTFPLMRPTGEISGRQAVTFASYFLQRPPNGRGKLFAGLGGSPGCSVLIIGLGTVGRAAGNTASALGAVVRVAHWDRRSGCECGFTCMWVHDKDFATTAIASDVIVGALRISTFDTPPLVTEQRV